MDICFDHDAFEEYNEWATLDKKTFKKIQKLIKETSRTPFVGIGDPEPLKHDLEGYWSRRINEKDRMVYRVDKDLIKIIMLKGHYYDK